MSPLGSNLVWWPEVSKDIEALVRSCLECQKLAILPRDPWCNLQYLITHWEKFASDLFELNKTTCLLVVYYFHKLQKYKSLLPLLLQVWLQCWSLYLLICYFCYPYHRQWTTVYFQWDESIFLHFLNLPNHWFILLPSSKWTSQTYCWNCRAITNKICRSLFGFA